MNNFISYYTKYTEHIDEYNRWNNEQNKDVKKAPSDYNAQNTELLKQKAKTIAEPLLLLDSYEHEKAEDSETFFQTYNIELMSVTSLLCSLPIAVTKAIPFLNKHAEKNSLIKKSAELLSKYKNSSINIAGKSISVSKIATVFSAIGSGIFYIKNMRKSMESQLGIIRKANFDATQNIIDNPNMFAVLTDEQEKEVNAIASQNKEETTSISDKIKDKVNITSSFKEVKEYKKNHKNFQNQKNEYFNQTKTNPQPISKDDKIIMESLLKNVEHDVLEPLRKVETISNISYSALFTGGFLEYLITDKLTEVLGVKSKPIQMGIKLGVPLLTYFLLNKNISDIENKAILATKYKHLKQFTENPLAYKDRSEENKQSLPEFIKTVAKDMKDYDEFAKNEMPKLKNKLEAKKQIKLSKEQEIQAKKLQECTTKSINNQRELLYNQSVGIKALSETILQPIDIIATAAGGAIGNKLAKKCPNSKIAGMLTGLGAVIAFIPAAIIEAKLTKQQKLSEKIAAMLALKDLKQNKVEQEQFILQQTSKVFSDFNIM